MDMAEFVAKIMADISKFERDVEKAMAMAEGLDDKVVVDIEASINDFRRDLLMAEALAKKFEADDIEKNVDLNTNGFMRGWRAIQDANDQFSSDMDELANSIRSFGTVGANVIKGGLLSSFTALIPIIAGLVPAIMAVGNALAVVGGGAIGLAGAFGILYGGVGGFALMATSAINMLNDGLIQANDATVNYQTALDGLKSTWQELIQVNSEGIFQTMANGLNVAKAALVGITPFLEGMITSMQNASQRMLEWANNSQTASNFFEMMGTTGVTVFDDMLNALGRFGSGFVNLFTQFGPLFEWTAQGFANMGAQFDAWSQKVSTAEGIKNFIGYVQTNLPLIGQIFGDTFMGIFNLFKAFGTNSQTIFEYLAVMAEKFRAWSETIAQSDGFQKFIDYVQTNGPTIMGLIGNIVMALVNFGIAAAPIGQTVLEIVTGFTQWIAKMFETQPIIAQIIAVMLTLMGVMMQLAPVIDFLIITIGLISAPIFLTIAAIGAWITVLVLAYQRVEWFRNAVNALANIFVTVGQMWLQGVQIIVSGVISGFTNLMGFLQSFNSFLTSVVANGWNTLTSLISASISVIVSVVSSGFSSLLSTASSITASITSVVSTGWSTLTSIISSAVSSALSFVSSGFASMLSAANSFASGLVSAITSAMSSFVSSVVSGASSALSALTGGLSAMVSAALGFVGDMTSAGVQLIMGMVNGITSAAGRLVSAAVSAVKGAISAAKSALGIHSPSRVFREIGAFTSEGLAIGIMDNARMAIDNVAQMASDMTDAYEPDFASVNASMDRDLGALNKDLRSTVDADIESGIKGQQPIVNVEVRNEGDAEIIRSYVNTNNGLDEALAF